jgi:hypothetical protein
VGKVPWRVGKVPWKELVPLPAALVGLGLAWAVARGMVQDSAAAVVNAAAAAAVAGVIAVSAWRGSRRAAATPAAAELRGEWRAALIDRVRLRWIGRRDATGRLTGGAKLAEDLALGGELELLVERVIARPAEGATTVLEAWRRSGHAVVLTGGPGTGKSVQLLLLAEKLLDEAERDESAGVPVILGLAGWRGDARTATPADTSHGFEDWLVGQIHAHFGLAPEHARSWLAAGSLIPILDGLDEAPAAHQSRLFRGIGTWIRGERPPVAWALGCRDEEYSRLDPKRELTTLSSSYWSTRPIDDRDRLRFLAHAQERSGADWQPVMDALARGAAAHLIRDDDDRPGVLASPLGIAIAVDAYRLSGLDDPARPADLVDHEGGWDRLWERYVAHRYATAHTDPDLRAGGPAEPFAFDDVRRWLGTISSDDSGLGRYVNVANLRRPDRPASWAALYRSAAATAPSEFVGGILVWWLVLFAGFGALVGWRGWSGSAGALLGLAVSTAGALLLLAALLRLGVERAFGLLADDAEPSRPEAGLLAVALIGFVALVGLPGFVLAGATAASFGVPVVRWLQPWVSRVDEWSVRIGGHDVGVGRVELGQTVTGAVTGIVVEAILALALGLIVGLVMLSYAGAMLVRHGRAWLDHVEPEEQFERWRAKQVLVRWWRRGSRDAGSGGGGSLLPRPREWDRFLHWAAHRGYLRRVGEQYLWMHETLRIWFQRHLDRDRLRMLFDTAPPDR